MKDWISVEDRLPEPGTTCIVCLANKAVIECERSVLPHWFKVGIAQIVDDNPVTHWMPMPEPPEEK